MISIAILILLTIQLRHLMNSKLIEGAVGSNTKQEKKYTNPELSEDPLYLATINAANIEYLRSRIERLGQLQVQFADVKTRVDTNTSALQSLSQSLHNTAMSSIPSKKTTTTLANSSSMGMNYNN